MKQAKSKSQKDISSVKEDDLVLEQEQDILQLFVQLDAMNMRISELERRINLLEIQRNKYPETKSLLKHKIQRWGIQLGKKSLLICWKIGKTLWAILVTSFQFLSKLTKKWGYKKTLALLTGVGAAMVILIWQPWQNLSNFTGRVDSPEKSPSRIVPSHFPQNSTKPQDKSSVKTKEPSWNESHPKRVITWEERGKEEHFRIEPEDQQTMLAVRKWSEISETGDLENRLTAIQELATLGSPSAGKQLIKLLESKDPKLKDLRWEVIRSLAKIKGYPPAISTLCNIASDPSENIENRREAVLSLGKIGSVKEKEFLLSILQNTAQDEELRANALAALGNIGDANVSISILSYLNDPSPLIREMSANTLGTFSYPNACKNLIELMHSDPVLDVRLAAIRALGELTGQATIIVPEMIKKWKTASEDSIRKELKQSLKNLSQKAKLPASWKSEVDYLIK